jgi:hypothetical protein
MILGFTATILGVNTLFTIPVHRLFFRTVAVVSYMSLITLIATGAAYSWVHTYLRLLNPVRAVDVPYYSQAVIAALLFGGVFTLLGFVGELVTYPHSSVSAFFYFFFQYFCCAGICLSMSLR